MSTTRGKRVVGQFEIVVLARSCNGCLLGARWYNPGNSGKGGSVNATVALKVIGYAVIPLVMAWLGGHLATTTIQDPKRRLMYRVAFLVIAVIGIVATLFVEITVEGSHTKETEGQRRDIGSLRGDLQRAETARQIDTAILKTKLEDAYQMNAQLAQFGPAIMKLAQTSAEYSRKQYETKVTSNKQLRDFTIDVVRRMRESERNHDLKIRQIIDKQMATVQKAATEEERRRLWNLQSTELTQQYVNWEFEFKSNILGDAVYAKDELLKRLGPQPELPPMEKSNLIVFRGILAGAHPVSGAAAYLEQLSKKLSP